jgi:hypothetical protein
MYALLPCAIGVGLIATSCSTGPRPPEPGTPALFWGAAQQVFKAGDLRKTSHDLLEILGTENEFTGKARIWEIALAAGMVKGSEDLAQAYESGAKMNRQNPAPFRKRVSQVRTMAGRSALDLAQQVHVLLAKEKGAEIVMEFPFPPGSAVEPPALGKVYAGVTLLEAAAEALETAMLERGTVQVVCRLTGNPDDPAKALETFKTPPVKVKREAYLLALAKVLYDEADIFTGNKLDQPQRLKVMCDEALEVIAAVPESKETKALKEKVQGMMKKARLT